MIKNMTSDSGEIVFVTAAQPNIGGMAPDAPPITIFMGVAGFKKIVTFDLLFYNIEKNQWKGGLASNE